MRLKSLLQTLLLLCIIVGLTFIMPLADILTSPFILIASWVGIVLLIGFYIYYVVVIKKSSLFCLAAFLSFILMSTAGFAAPQVNDQALIEQNKNEIKKYSSDVCSKSDNYTYDATVLEKAHKVVDLYKTLEGGSSSFGGTSDIESTYKCATDYIEHAGQIQKTAKTTCSPISLLLKNAIQKKDCWPCDITALVINAIQKMAVASYSVINEAALALLGGIFLVWLAITVLIFFGKFGFSRFSEFFTAVLNQAILVLIIAAILHAPLVNFYRIVISPFITYTAGLAISFSDIGTDSIGQNSSVLTSAVKFLGIRETRCSYCTDMAKSSDIITTGQFMDSQSINGVLCLVCTVYRQVAPMISLGQTMSCYATAIPKTMGGLPAFSAISLFSVPNLSLLTIGWLLVIMFTLLMFIIGFYVMSVMMKLGFVLILTPLFLVAFAFKFSRNYAKQAWILVVHSMLTLVAIAIAVSLLLIGFNALLPKATLMGFVQMIISDNPQTIAGNFSGAMTGAGSSGGFGDMSGMIMNGVTGGGGGGFSTFLLIAYAFISLHIIDASSKVIERLSGAFINLSNTGIDALVSGAGMGVNAAKSTGEVVGSGAGKIKEKLSGSSSKDSGSSNVFSKAANKSSFEDQKDKDKEAKKDTEDRTGKK